MQIEYYPLRRIEKWPGNPKDHDLWFLQTSINEHGFNDPMARDANTGKLVEGHGRTSALRQMKDKGQAPPDNIIPYTGPDDAPKNITDEVAPNPGDWLVPVITLDFDSDEQVEAYILAHNKAAERGGWDDELLAEVLQRQFEGTGEVKDTGFSPDEAEALLDSAGLTDDVDPTDPDEIEFGDDGPTVGTPEYDVVDSPTSGNGEDHSGSSGVQANTGVKQMQLLLERENYLKVQECLKDLAQVFGTETSTDTVLEVILEAHERHCTAKEE